MSPASAASVSASSNSCSSGSSASSSGTTLTWSPMFEKVSFPSPTTNDRRRLTR